MQIFLGLYANWSWYIVIWLIENKFESNGAVFFEVSHEGVMTLSAEKAMAV